MYFLTTKELCIDTILKTFDIENQINTFANIVSPKLHTAEIK